MSKKRTTFGVVSIADEVLSGKTAEKNAEYICKLITPLGYQVAEIATIQDSYEAIIPTISRLSEKYDHVITSGGIGTTHDDITYSAVAKWVNDDLVVHYPTVERLAAAMKPHPIDPATMDESRLRMCTFPESAIVHEPAPNLWVPVVQVRNVNIYPGIPTLFQKMINHSPHLFGTDFSQKTWMSALYSTAREADIAIPLKEIHDQWIQHNIRIGSYPQEFSISKGKSPFVKITVEGESQDLVNTVVNQIHQTLPNISKNIPPSHHSTKEIISETNV